MKLTEALPELVGEIQTFLVSEGRNEIAIQFRDLTLLRWTGDPAAKAMYVYLAGQRPLNQVEQHVVGTRHGECIVIDSCEGMVVLDTDNFNRVTGIEILDREDIREILKKLRSSS